MLDNQNRLPIEIQLQAVCLPDVSDTYDMLVSFLPGLKKWDIQNETFEAFKERIKEQFNFSAIELIEFLKTHPEACQDLLSASSDKRYTPSTFIHGWENNQYRVGWVPRGGSEINQIRVFSNLAEASADYVLFSWGYPRPTKEEASWFEMEHY